MSKTSIPMGVILPAYNEATVIGSVLDALPTKLKVDNEVYIVKIIVVNDGSKDQTQKIVSQRRHVYLVNHLLNSGAGAATRTGLRFARELGCKYAVTMDADGQHDTNDVIKLMKAIVKEEAPFIIGSRLIETKGMPWYRVLGNKGLSFITFLLFGAFVSDSQSGLRAFNKRALDSIRFYSNNYAFCSEMIWNAKKQDIAIKEVPIKAIYTDYSLSKGQSNWGALHIIAQLIKRRFLGLMNE